MKAWRPAPGQLALLEPAGDDAGREVLTGVVLPDDDRVLVDLGASPRPAAAALPMPVVASFFASDALYRLTATAEAVDGSEGVVALAVDRVERIQRRSAPRARMELPVSLAAFDGPGPFTTVKGYTIDVAVGGCRVATEGQFPPGVEPTVSIALPHGAPVVALARVLEAITVDGHHEYRLAFAQIADEDQDRLARL
jgi:c-di-GMP-binding flagellar brake protein YcgR